MKKIIGIVIASMMFANIGYAEMRLIEEKVIRATERINMATICVDGFKFVVTKGGEGRSMVQFMIPGPRIDSPPYPAEC